MNVQKLERLNPRRDSCGWCGGIISIMLAMMNLSSCSQGSLDAQENLPALSITLNEYGLSIGGLLIDSTTTKEQLTQSLGKPSRVSIPTETELRETLDRFGNPE